jgi:hydroxymethylglutaryl-CoA lyase
VTSDVQIFEVSLRDGLQNEPVVVPTARKLAHLRRLLDAGVKDIEVSSFVRPDRVPALADAEELLALAPRDTDARFWVLVPNLVGMDRALATGVRHICTFLSASETHNRKNVNRTVRESLGELRRALSVAADEGIRVRAYIATVFGCPYEGRVPVERTVDVALRLLEWGAGVVVLGDTIGAALPDRVEQVLEALDEAGVGPDRIALHAHDTRGTALVNIYTAWRCGLTRFDASIAGIGGCPYAPGASGNAATEDVVHMFEGMGLHTGIDLDRLALAGREMASVLGRELPGRVHRALVSEAERRRRSA